MIPLAASRGASTNGCLFVLSFAFVRSGARSIRLRGLGTCGKSGLLFRCCRQWHPGEVPGSADTSGDWFPLGRRGMWRALPLSLPRRRRDCDLWATCGQDFWFIRWHRAHCAAAGDMLSMHGKNPPTRPCDGRGPPSNIASNPLYRPAGGDGRGKSHGGGARKRRVLILRTVTCSFFTRLHSLWSPARGKGTPAACAHARAIEHRWREPAVECVGVKMHFFFWRLFSLRLMDCVRLCSFSVNSPRRRLFTPRPVTVGKSRLSYRLAANVVVFVVSLCFLPSCCARRCARCVFLHPVTSEKALEFTLRGVCTNWFTQFYDCLKTISAAGSPPITWYFSASDTKYLY